jgi:hypothetical protein
MSINMSKYNGVTMRIGFEKDLYSKVGLLTVVAILVCGFGGSSVYGKAQTENINFKSDFSSAAIPLCGGELVFFAGTAHFTSQQTVTPSGKLMQEYHMNYQKTSGEGVGSGDKYEINEVDTTVYHQDDDSDPKIIHFVISGQLIHNGKETNTIVTLNLLTVFDENGDPKTTVEDVRLKCNG